MGKDSRSQVMCHVWVHTLCLGSWGGSRGGSSLLSSILSAQRIHILRQVLTAP